MNQTCEECGIEVRRDNHVMVLIIGKTVWKCYCLDCYSAEVMPSAPTVQYVVTAMPKPGLSNRDDYIMNITTIYETES